MQGETIYGELILFEKMKHVMYALNRNHGKRHVLADGNNNVSQKIFSLMHP